MLVELQLLVSLKKLLQVHNLALHVKFAIFNETTSSCVNFALLFIPNTNLYTDRRFKLISFIQPIQKKSHTQVRDLQIMDLLAFLAA